jgi:hypothetical protein
MSMASFHSMSARQRALVGLAVLLDGREAADFLKQDKELGTRLAEAAITLAALEPQLRMPFVGTNLRSALREVE